MTIAIIGGGAAGMMAAAAITAENPKIEIFLIEKNAALGKKVLISGGGRCNVTTGLTDMQKLRTKYPRGARFLQHALYTFPPEKVTAWFENHGVPLKIEKDLRVFPQSNNGKDVVDVFEKIFAAHRTTKILCNHNVEKIEKMNDGFQIFLKGKEPLRVDKVILTTGGQAYRHTGSTGDGYTFAESLGHTITPLAPSLTSFITQEQWPKKLAGVSIVHATLTAKGTKKMSTEGPFLFTHWGISGPAVFALSAATAFETYNDRSPLQITIDLLPLTKGAELEKELTKIMQEHPQKTIENTIAHFVPKSLGGAICENCGIPLDKKNSAITKKERHLLIETLKNLKVHAVGRGAGDEFVTAGGVTLEEVERTTMESKICPGLFFAGEILNIDGFTGGFNLQAAWATGKLAGENAA